MFIHHLILALFTSVNWFLLSLAWRCLLFLHKFCVWSPNNLLRFSRLHLGPVLCTDIIKYVTLPHVSEVWQEKGWRAETRNEEYPKCLNSTQSLRNCLNKSVFCKTTTSNNVNHIQRFRRANKSQVDAKFQHRLSVFNHHYRAAEQSKTSATTAFSGV